MLGGVELLDNWAGLEDWVRTRRSEGEVSLAYQELSVELLETHIVNIGIFNSFGMAVVMACICKTDKECKTDSRANDAPTSERHVYMCP
jgi:hypothetical protein